MGFIHLKLKDENGAASVLVILIMVVFSVLGLLAMIYAYSNYRLSQKTLAWNEEYYALDTLGEEALGEINQILFECKSSAGNGEDFSLLAGEALNTWLEGKNRLIYNSWQPQPQLNKGAEEKEEGIFGFALRGENNTLQIGLLPLYIPEKKGEYYSILNWSIKRPDYNYDTNPFDNWEIIEE